MYMCHNNQQKMNESVYIPEDICCSVMEFLEGRIILGTCIRISRQWLKASSRLELSLTISKSIPMIGNIISTSLYIGKLKELRLLGVGSGDLCKILKSEKVKNLTALEIANRVLSLEDCKLISLSEFSKHLKKLKLKECGLDEHGIKVLAESHQLTNLTSLDLCCNKLSVSGGKLIENSPNFSNLTELKLNNCDIGPGGFRQIQSNLKYLENFIDPSGDVYIKMVTGASFTIPVTSETTYKDITELLYEKAGYSFSRFVCISARKLLLENEQVVPGSLIYAVTTLRGG